MKRIILFLVIALMTGLQDGQAQVQLDTNYFNSLRYKHDLNLPDWGPYTKNYIGVSHIPDIDKGIRFDLSVFPCYYRRKVDAPNVFYESGYHPWEAAPNLEYFSFRHELEWKDKVYTDVSYSVLTRNSRAIRIACVNNTELIQSIGLHMMASIHFPPLRPYAPNTPIYPLKINLPENAKWIDALDYKNYEYAKPSHRNNLVYDGKLRGEKRANGLVNGSGIEFGKNAGDEVIYNVVVDNAIVNPVLYLRYKTVSDTNAVWELSGAFDKQIQLSLSKSYRTIVIPDLKLKPGRTDLKVVSKAQSEVLLDGFVIVSESDTASIHFEEVTWDRVPELIEGPVANSIILKYPDTDNYYGIYWEYPDFFVREFFYEELSDDFRKLLYDYWSTKLYNGTDGHFTNIYIRPIHLEPHSTKIIDGLVCTGTKEEVFSSLKNIKTSEIEIAEKNAKSKLLEYETVPAGEKYLFSQKRMAATTACNIVYPVYTQKKYIRHHTPGRFWDCLYTWDSGFLGLGLTQLNAQRGIESLNAYVNEPDEQSAFIHHGTPIPVQHYLFQELWHKTQSGEFVEAYYPKLKVYYEFLAGKTTTSTTANLNSGLIRTWDYFYNSGWDDYPPQSYMHAERLSERVTPAVTTAHIIRIAKILKLAAQHLGLENDVIIYDKDIKRMGDALNKYAWDDNAGYYGYVVHNEKGDAESLLMYNDTVNFNMGMGGAYPLVADICNKEQTEKLLSHLKTRGRIWSDIGLTAVDQAAPYYSKDGYWNGTVWMPHQWFFWKSMLDLGEADFANKIAVTALDLWKKETESTYNCFEHFVIETERGAGWHEFGGLSTPVLSWFNSYYKQGTLTTGHNVWIENYAFNDSKSELNADFRILKSNSDYFAVVVCLNPEYTYSVSWQGKEIEYKEFNKGTLSIKIPYASEKGKLYIKKR